jgi:hypothetical protein
MDAPSRTFKVPIIAGNAGGATYSRTADVAPQINVLKPAPG